jgi:YVTN family beta-propeller protein
MTDPSVNRYVSESRARRRRQIRRRRRVLLVAVVLVVVAVVAGAAVGLTRNHGKRGSGSPATAAGHTPHPAATKSPATSASPHPSASASASPLPRVGWTGPPSSTLRLRRGPVIGGSLSSKSVVATQTGLVFAQNMMYRHTVTVYNDRTFRLVKTISDAVHLARLGYPQYSGVVRGAPVEAAVAPNRHYIYVSNYSMYGPGFYHEGHDVGGPGSGYDRSFVYRIDLRTLAIDQAIEVGSVPKFLEVTPDGRYLLVSNWDSYTLSICSVVLHRQTKTIYLGPYPRGIAVDPKSRWAYVAVMGSTRIAKISLQTWAVHWIYAGSGPRHLCMSPNGRWLYATLNAEGTVAKIDLRTDRVIARVATGSQPRSMTIAPDGASLDVVNYASNTVSKIRTSDMRVVQVVRTNAAPIGISYDAVTHDVWVACYTGTIMVFHDR